MALAQLDIDWTVPARAPKFAEVSVSPVDSGSLTEIERACLIACFVEDRKAEGDHEPVSHDAIAELLGISRSRVYQIEASAMRKLKPKMRRLVDQ